MSSGSYTIEYINPPANGQDLVNNTAPAFIGAQNNNFSVSQTFSGGIVDSGNLTVAGTSRFTGVCTFDAIPQFDAGIEVDISTLSTGALTVSGASALNGGLTVLGSVVLPGASVSDSALSSNVDKLNVAQTYSAVKTFGVAPVLSGASIIASSVPAASIVNASLTNTQIAPGGIGQASVSNGYTDLLSAQTVAGVKTFSSAPVMSGASISASTIPAASIVADSIGDAQIATAGIGQTSVSNGYVDLSSAQTVAGVKTFSGVCSFPNGVSSTTFTGDLAGNATTATLAQTVNILSDNSSGTCYVPFLKTNVGSDSLFVDDATSPFLTYSPLTGALSAGSLTTSSGITAGGLTSSNGLVVTSNNYASIQGGLVLPVAQTVLTIVAGSVALNLNNYSFNEFILPSANFTATITSMTFTNAIVNSKFNILILGGASNRNVNKALSSGTIQQVNNLSGNTQFAAGSVWRCQGTILSPVLASLQFTNFT